MKTADFIYHARARGNKGALFRVRLFQKLDSTIIALVSDIDSGIGPSITNCVEYVRNDLIQDLYIKKEALFIENYQNTGRFYYVSFSDENKPGWIDINIKEVANLCECDLDELKIVVGDVERLQKELYEKRLQIDPNFFKIPEENSQVIERRRNISMNKISKNELVCLINKNPGEKEIQSLLCKDLSILGEAHATLHEEYICFSEFPLSNGRVDYAIFTGRSRMNILLVEIKGAEFNFLTQGNYRNFSAKINEATQQMTARLGIIAREYDSFHRSVHHHRELAENGQSKLKSLLGPGIPLEVDPDKDVSVFGMVIGGRSTDDQHESRVRHDFELQNPKIQLHSWGSWLRKINRWP